MSTVDQFLNLVAVKGSDATYHRDDSSLPCPCRTPEGYRDPEWHLVNPQAPVCNEAGYLSFAVEVGVKAFIQPIQSTRATRLQTEQVLSMFGEVQKDDHLGIFPCSWSSTTLNFDNWGPSAEDWVEYRGKRFTVVNANLIPDPDDGNPFHHWECGLRLINPEPL